MEKPFKNKYAYYVHSRIKPKKETRYCLKCDEEFTGDRFTRICPSCAAINEKMGRFTN